MPLLKAKTTVDLSEVSEVDLITALYNKDISLEYIESSYYALDEQDSHKWDDMTGESEYGLHGKQSSKPKPKATDESVDTY